MDNQAIIGRCLQLVNSALADFIRTHFPDEKTDDPAYSFKLITGRWYEIGADLPLKARTLAHEMRDVRNEWAHRGQFSNDDTYRALDTAERLLASLALSNGIEDIRNLRGLAEKQRSDGIVELSRQIIRVEPPPPPRTAKSGDCREKLLSNINLSVDPRLASYKCLMERLYSISHQVYGRIEEKQGRIPRHYIPLDFGWINETRIEPAELNGEAYLQVLFHIGDTKEQGEPFFGMNPGGVNWPSTIRGYKLLARPFIKIGTPFSGTILWIRPTEAESSITHSQRFFNEFAGAVSREDWDGFGARLSQHVADWPGKCFVRDSDEHTSWEDKVASKKYQTIRVSIGTNLRILFPYAEAQSLDTDVNNSLLAATYREIIEEIKEWVERPVKAG